MSNQDPGKRLDKMAQWAAGINEWRDGIDEELETLLSAKITATLAPSDEIVARLGEALDEQAALPETIGTLKIEVVHRRERINDIDEELDVIEARGMLNADGSNKEKREAQLTLFVADNEDAAALKKERSQLDTEMRVKEAQIEELEMKDKHIGRLIHVLTAQLENLTARIR